MLVKRRRSPVLGLAMLSAGLLLLLAPTADAEGSMQLEPTVSEPSVASAPGEPASGPSSTSDVPPATGTPTESTVTAPEQGRARGARRGGKCSITLEATGGTGSPGPSPSLIGILSCPETAEAAEQTVTLYQKPARTQVFAPVSATVTDTNGAFEIVPADLERNSAFFVRADGARSVRVAVKVAPRITLLAPAPGTSMSPGGVPGNTGTEASVAATFSGTVNPAAAGAIVVLQRLDHRGVWHRIASGTLDSEGDYSITHTFSRAGVAEIRAVVRSHRLNVPAASVPVIYEVPPRHGN